LKNSQYDRLPYPSGFALRLTLGLRRGSTYLHYRRTQPPACAGCLIPSALPSSQPQALALDQPSGPASRTNLRPSSAAALLSIALQSTSGSHLRSTFQPCLRTQPPTLIGCRIVRRCVPASLQLAPPANLSALPSDPSAACVADRSSSFSVRPNLRLSSAAASPALPSGHPATCAADRPSRLTVRPISSFRLRSILRICLPALLPTCVFRLAFQPHLELNLRLLGCCILRRCPPVNLQLAPLTDLPALPADPTSDSTVVASPASPSSRPLTCVSDQPSGHLPIQPSACASNRIFRPLYIQPSACASDQTLGHLPIDLSLSLGIDLPAPPSDQPFSFRFRSTFRLMPSNSTSD